MAEQKTSTLLAVLEKIVVPLVVAIISAGTTYFITTYEKSPPNLTEVAFESMPVHIFAFAGNNNPEGGWSTFDTYFVDGQPSYAFKYLLPSDGTKGYAGLTFNFEKGEDFSEYKTISFLLTIPPDEEADLIIKDIAGKELRYRVRGGPQTETRLEIPLDNFRDLNLKAVLEMMFFVDTGFTSGDHTLMVRDLKLLR